MSPESVTSPRQTNSVLSRDLSEFVIELSIALHKYGMYPGGHPSLDTARARVTRRLEALLVDRATLTLGVARDQLIVEGVATDAQHPLLSGLARHLHRHDIGAMEFSAGVEDAEMGEMLRVVATDPGRSGPVMHAGTEREAPSWSHVRLFRLTYDKLQMAVEGEAEGTDARSRAAQLWLDLASAAMQGDVGSSDDGADPTLVADAINSHAREQAYDQVITGYLLKIADELASGAGAESDLLRKRVSRLIKGLRPDQLRRILEMGGDIMQRRRFLLDSARGMAVDAVLAIVQAAADASNQVISTALLRMLGKLAAHAQEGATDARPEAETALREQITRLVDGWQLKDPTGPRYGAILDRMASESPDLVLSGESTRACEAERLIEMSLEVGCMGGSVRAAIDAMVERGDLKVLALLLRRAPMHSPASELIRQYVGTPDQLRRALAIRVPDAEGLDWLVQQLGERAVDPLLDVLETATSRAIRRRVLQTLGGLGSDVADAAIARLPSAPWYFQRNLLILLDKLDVWPDGFSLTPYATHADARVRREAIRALLRMPSERSGAMVAALRDRDEQVTRIALKAALGDCPSNALRAIVERLARRDLDADLDLLAIRVVAASRMPEALQCLLDSAQSGGGWFRGRRLATKSPRLLAALAGLAANWASDPGAAVVLAKAARHQDAAVRAAAAGQAGAA